MNYGTAREEPGISPSSWRPTIVSTLQRAIGSVARQTYGDWELVIVDDGYTDATSAIFASIVDPLVKISAPRAGPRCPRGQEPGFDHMSGEWFTVLDSDDEMMPELSSHSRLPTCTSATIIECNCIDSMTEMSGKGLTHDGWLTADDMARRRGEFGGLTRMSSWRSAL